MLLGLQCRSTILTIHIPDESGIQLPTVLKWLNIFIAPGILDLRMDDPTDPDKAASASEVLQHIDERGLIRMLKAYGGLKTKARFVAEAILEARYMFHHFQTTQVSFLIGNNWMDGLK